MNLLVDYALNALWQVPLLAGGGWLVNRLCRQTHPRMQHRIWVATLLLGVMLPAVEMRSAGSTASARIGLVGVRLLTAFPDLSPQRHLFEHSVLAISHAWINSLAGVYLLLVLAAILRLLSGVIKAQELSRVSELVTLTPEQQQIWQRCRSVFSIEAAVLCTSNAISGPAVVGSRPPVLLLPPHFLQETTDEELLAALAHECAHIARRDYLLNVLYECLALPIAWHPLTAMLKAQLAQTREVACDQMVAETVMQPALYASALLRLVSRIPARLQGQNIHAVGIFDANILEKRVMNLKTKHVALGWGKKAALALAGMIVAGACAVSAVALTVEVDPLQMTSAAQPGVGHVYKIGGDILAPQLIYSVDPSFPSAKEQPTNFHGVVVLKMVVDKMGLPNNVEVFRSLAPKFDKSAIAAVRKYRFNPAMRNGQPVDVSVNVEVHFAKY